MTRPVSISLLCLAAAAAACEPSSSGPIAVACDGSAPSDWTHTEGAAVDYTVDCLLQVTDTLTIGPGTVVAFGTGGGISVDGGQLVAEGTAEAPIALQAAKPDAYWTGLALFGDAEQRLAHVTVTDAGASTPLGMASVIVGLTSYDGGTASIRDCVIDDGPGFGLLVGEGGHLTAFSGNTIVNKDVPVAVNLDNLGDLDPNNTLTGNAVEAIEVLPVIEASEAGQTWPMMPIPYLINETLTTAATQFVSPGVNVQLGGGASINFINFSAGKGGLVAEGTADLPITFDGAAQTPGDWNSLVLTGGTSSLSHVHIGWGSGADNLFGQSGMVVLDANGGAEVSIRDCVFEGSASNAVFLGLASHNDDIEAANTFLDNAKGDVVYGY